MSCLSGAWQRQVVSAAVRLADLVPSPSRCRRQRDRRRARSTSSSHSDRIVCTAGDPAALPSGGSLPVFCLLLYLWQASCCDLRSVVWSPSSFVSDFLFCPGPTRRIRLRSWMWRGSVARIHKHFSVSPLALSLVASFHQSPWPKKGGSHLPRSIAGVAPPLPTPMAKSGSASLEPGHPTVVVVCRPRQCPRPGAKDDDSI